MRSSNISDQKSSSSFVGTIFKTLQGATVVIVALLGIFIAKQEEPALTTLSTLSSLSTLEDVRVRIITANTIKICVEEMILITPRPSVGAHVQCWDKDPNGDDVMQSGETNSDGCLVMSYKNQGWDQVLGVGDSNPDIFCSVEKEHFVRAVPKPKDGHDQRKVADFGKVTLYRDRNSDWGKTNGCGPEKTEFFGNYVASFVTRFGDQCTQHDKCYWDCQIYKAYRKTNSQEEAARKAQEFCDNEMAAGMYSYCYYWDGDATFSGEASCVGLAKAIREGLGAVGSIFAYDKTDAICGPDAPSMKKNTYPLPSCTSNGIRCGFDGTFKDDLEGCENCCGGKDDIAIHRGKVWNDHFCHCIRAGTECGKDCDKCCNGHTDKVCNK